LGKFRVIPNCDQVAASQYPSLWASGSSTAVMANNY
jgi:hypothetical protein